MIEYTIKLAGTDCSVAEWNSSGSILVFALHGWLDNLASFERLANHMPNIRLIAFDFPGHGHSAHLPDGYAYHFIDGIYLIDDLARHFKQKKVNLLGHSMGGAVSTLYAAAQVNRVKKLVLIDSLGPLTVEPEGSSTLLQNAINQRAALMSKSPSVYADFDQALTTRALVSNIQPELIEPIVKRGLTQVKAGYIWRADSRLRTASPIRMAEVNLIAVFKHISASVLLLMGDKGFIKNNKNAQTRLDAFQNIEKIIVSGGHHVHLEEPAVCGLQIDDFFRKND